MVLCATNTHNEATLMFEKLLTALFSKPEEPTSDEPSIYETAFRPTGSTSHAPAVSASRASLSQQESATSASPQTLKVDIDTLDRRAFLFYDHLLGPSKSSSTLNPLEQHILSRVDLALKKPQAVLAHVPVLPQSVLTLTRLLNDPEFSLIEFVTVVEKEPSVASEIIRVANGSRYNHSGKDITNLKQAFMLLGANDVKEHVLAHFVRDMCKVSPVYFRNFGDKIWQHSFDVATTAQTLAEHRGEDPNSAYLMGLMHDLGKIVIFQFMVEAFKTMHPDYKQDSLVFKKFLSEKSMQLSVELMKTWEMPSLIIKVSEEMAEHSDAVALNQTEVSPLGRILIEANLISELLMLHRDTDLANEDFTALVNASALSEGGLELLQALTEQHD